MAILIDPPIWPGHGTVWSHLVSDTSLVELHEFAARNDLPQRAFDGDHYDVPELRHLDLIAAGARPVPARDLIRALLGSGLRLRKKDRRR